MRGTTVILAAGGTGGHIFPALSLGRVLVARGLGVALVTDDRGGRYEGDNPGIILRHIRAASPSLGGAAGKAKAVLELGIGALQAARHIRQLGGGVAVGFGGYPSAPTIRAATFLGLPVLLHEQNAVLGRANRFLVPQATRIATSFAGTARIPGAAQARCVFTGNPVRQSLIDLRDTTRTAAEDGTLNLLVFGGSQGASVFASVVPGAVAALPEELRGHLRITQQARAEDTGRVEAEYARLGVSADIRPFFDDLPQRMAAADLVIARAGASTVAELTALGRPAILVPYPSASDDHQTLNARALEAAGAAWLMAEADGFTAPKLAERLGDLLHAPERLRDAAAAARAFGTPGAAAHLADLVIAAISASGPASGPTSGAGERT